MAITRYYIDVRLTDSYGKINSFNFPLTADIDEMRNVCICGCYVYKKCNISEYKGSNFEWLKEWVNREWSGEKLFKASKINIKQECLT